MRAFALDCFASMGRPYYTWPITGASMRPTLADGDLVVIDPTPRELRRGDLLYYEHSPRDEAVHRLLGPATAEDGAPQLRTRGDGQSRLDAPLPRARVRGVIVAIRASGTWWDLTGGGARAWALAVALHDLAWSRLAAVAARLDRAAFAWVQTLDRALLGFAHRRAFGWFHRRLDGPPPGTFEAHRGAERIG